MKINKTYFKIAISDLFSALFFIIKFTFASLKNNTHYVRYNRKN